MKLTSEQKEYIINEKAKGKTYYTLAKELGVSVNTIMYWTNPDFKAKNKIAGKKYVLENKEKFYKSQLFSMIKSRLKQGMVSKQELLDKINSL